MSNHVKDNELSEEFELLWNECLQRQGSSVSVAEQSLRCNEHSSKEHLEEASLQTEFPEGGKKMEEKEIKPETVEQASAELKQALLKIFPEELAVHSEDKGTGIDCEEGQRGNRFCTGILLTGKTATEVLERSIQEVEEEDIRYFSVITIKTEPVKRNNTEIRLRLRSSIKAAILGQGKHIRTNAFVLVLEDFNEEQIIDIWESGFLRKVLLNQFISTLVIFLSPTLCNLDKFTNMEANIVVPEADKVVEICMISDSGSCTNSTEEQFIDDDLYTTAATIRKSEKREELMKKATAELPILVQPNPDFGNPRSQLHNDTIKEEIKRESNNYALPMGSLEKKHGKESTTEPVQRDDNANGISCLSRIFQYFSEAITQCGDCCC